MGTLSDIKKKELIRREPSLGYDRILTLIQEYDNLDLSDFPNMDEEKKRAIQRQLNSVPNPQEQNEWENVSSAKVNYDNTMASAQSFDNKLNTAQDFLNKLGKYISRWEKSLPASNHVDDAKQLYTSIDNSIKQLREEIEEEDWNRVDIGNNGSILGHLLKYPGSVHKDDIDDLYWENTNIEDIVAVEDYLQHFSAGRNKQKAESVKRALVDWVMVKESYDIFAVNRYVKDNPTSPFAEQAKLMLMKLKSEEITRMKEEPNAYEVDTLMSFLRDNIFSETELIQQDVLTEDILKALRDPNYFKRLPDIQLAVERSVTECINGHTDVYFFGVPSTGKTCILMGLVSSTKLDVELAHGGGDYAAALQHYVQSGVTVPRTEEGFIATLDATINSDEDGSTHKINLLVEMAGEDFAWKIAKNKSYSFADMGTGATDLLKNDNRKIFFLIIDPTTDVLELKKRIVIGFDEMTGESIYDIQETIVKQQVLIDTMIDLMCKPENAEIMKKVNSIHVIITKADLIGEGIDRETNAYKLFRSKYGTKLTRLKKICKEYNINSIVKDKKEQFKPKLHTFSLGKFYIGGLYEYDQTDSDKLITVIKNNSARIKELSLWEKIKILFN